MDFNEADKSWYLTGGIEKKLIDSLSKHFNFQYRVIHCNNNWGKKLANGTWNGIIGKVWSGDADFGIGGITQTKERSEAVSFSSVYLFSPVSFITPPDSLKPPITLVLEPFSIPVWMSVIFALLLIILMQWFIIEKIYKVKENHFTLPIISMILNQSVPCSFPKIHSLRIMLAFWMIACFLIGTYYGGFLAALLAVPRKAYTIDTLEELAREQAAGHIQVAGSGGSIYFNLIKVSVFAKAFPFINEKYNF